MKKIYQNISVIILAAGTGTRMRSNKAKVLHQVLGRPMVLYVIEIGKKVAGQNIILVIGNQAEKVRKIVSAHASVQFAYQEEQLGTGHAVLCAIPYLPEHCDEVIILYGDVPLIRPETIFKLIETHGNKNLDVTVLAVEIDRPTGYGRLIIKDQTVERIVEESDATDDQKKIKTINTGIYCVKKTFLIESLKQIKSNNAQGEFYLTDIIEIGNILRKKVGFFMAKDFDEFQGINTTADLKKAEILMRNHDCIKS